MKCFYAEMLPFFIPAAEFQRAQPLLKMFYGKNKNHLGSR
jgi:hypothetical protein